MEVTWECNLVEQNNNCTFKVIKKFTTAISYFNFRSCFFKVSFKICFGLNVYVKLFAIAETNDPTSAWVELVKMNTAIVNIIVNIHRWHLHNCHSIVSDIDIKAT